MTRATAKYSGEELEVEFSGVLQNDWIGDPSVPNGTQEVLDLSEVDIETITILGVGVDKKVLPIELQEKILELHEELEFEADEPDYDDY